MKNSVDALVLCIYGHVIDNRLTMSVLKNQVDTNFMTRKKNKNMLHPETNDHNAVLPDATWMEKI